MQETGNEYARAAYRPSSLWALLAVAIALATLRSPFAIASGQTLAARPADPLAPVLDKMYNAEYADGQRMLELWLKSHPDDFRALNYLAESMMDREMLREQLFNGSAYMNSGQAFQHRKQPLPEGFQQRLNGIFDKAQGLEEARLKEDSKDQEALYWLGVTHGGRTEFDFILLRSYFAALHEGKQSLKDNERLLKLNPDFTDAYFVIGLAKYTVGMLPWYIKLVTSLAFAHGSLPQGIADLQRVSQHGHYARVDAQIVLVTIYERQKQYAQALALLRGLTKAYAENYLAPLEVARVEKAQGDWRAAAQTYDAAVEKFVDREKDPGRVPTAELLYRDGEAHEHLGDLQKALDVYHRAGKLPGTSMQIYKADVAAARLDQRFNHIPQAKAEYQIVVQSIPDTDIGRQARQALGGLH
jgi:tetratricopeptide (TPR) repeat protein